MLGVQSGPSRTMWVPEMAETWPSGPSPASDIDIWMNFTKATLIPNIISMLEVQFGPSRTMWGRKWPNLGHQDHPQPNILIVERIALRDCS